MIRQELDIDRVERYVEAPPEAVYDVIADVTRTPELSPEVKSCAWVRGATGPTVGACFRAWSKVPGRPAWRNTPVSSSPIAAESSRSPAQSSSGARSWRYVFTPEGSGTRVTESYEVTKPIPLIGCFGIGRLYSLRDRRSDLRCGMHATLERLAVTVGQPTAAGYKNLTAFTTPRESVRFCRKSIVSLYVSISAGRAGHPTAVWRVRPAAALKRRT